VEAAVAIVAEQHPLFLVTGATNLAINAGNEFQVFPVFALAVRADIGVRREGRQNLHHVVMKEDIKVPLAERTHPTARGPPGNAGKTKFMLANTGQPPQREFDGTQTNRTHLSLRIGRRARAVLEI
jgi:hypothetical protein